MFCGNCGTELTEGAKFCPNCGAPAPAVVEERETDTPGPESARPRRRLAAPLVTALVVLALATTSSAAYLVYALVIAPLPPRGEQGADAPAGEGEDAARDAPAEKDADAPAGDAASTDEAPAPEPEESHYYECGYFYVDVPDAWQTGTILEEGEGSWNFAHPEGQYVNATVLTTDPNPMSGHQWLVGTTSDGTRIWGNDAATGFFGEGKGTIALK